ncbi:class I SAM-dependent methyltransferase [Rapidithrix thailandica]|uniref:Class I SAM-dependent methyltransferase n=1 Tax=Rapidithrix thailandica TaxID=413964 RepID=A0AAW9SIZ0_9BACT
MDTRQAYNLWASQYDSNKNKTRDLEGTALRKTLPNVTFKNCLEIGCGTGKNTEWLIKKAEQITAIDLSDEMLAKAREKVTSEKVRFYQADITKEWTFVTEAYDLVGFSLVLEHIADLNPIFQQVAQVLTPGGYVYIGELHPFKQYLGSKARFDTSEGRQEVPCFTHAVSEFVQVAKNNGLTLMDLNEYFDKEGKKEIPRILTLLLKKPV